jgi:hypothetical protein
LAEDSRSCRPTAFFERSNIDELKVALGAMLSALKSYKTELYELIWVKPMGEAAADLLRWRRTPATPCYLALHQRPCRKVMKAGMPSRSPAEKAVARLTST